MTSTSETADFTAPNERARISHASAFLAVAGIFVLFTAASSVPSPLYIIYQEAWDFSAITLTFVFGIYVVGLLGSLLVVGSLSDHIGRKPVLAAAVGLEAVALILFITANGIPMLALARVLQGIATGAAMTTLGAALVDLDPPHAPGRAGLINGVAPLSGLAIGALGCGFLVQYGPAPTHLVFAFLLGGMLLSAAIIRYMPETSIRRPGGMASLRPKVGIPERLRPQVYALVPIVVASWALGGLYLSLGPSVAATVFGLKSHVIGGLVVTLLCGTGATAAAVLRNRELDDVMKTAGILLAVGMVVTLAGVELGSAILAAIGTLIAGVGFGAAALGSFGTLARIAAPHERGELFAVAYVISYVAFSVPALLAGLATSSSFGLQNTTMIYGLAVIAFAVAALYAQRLLISRREQPA